jgi:hypothetical protein
MIASCSKFVKTSSNLDGSLFLSVINKIIPLSLSKNMKRWKDLPAPTECYKTKTDSDAYYDKTVMIASCSKFVKTSSNLNGSFVFFLTTWKDSIDMMKGSIDMMTGFSSTRLNVTEGWDDNFLMPSFDEAHSPVGADVEQARCSGSSVASWWSPVYQEYAYTENGQDHKKQTQMHNKTVLEICTNIIKLNFEWQFVLMCNHLNKIIPLSLSKNMKRWKDAPAVTQC